MSTRPRPVAPTRLRNLQEQFRLLVAAGAPDLPDGYLYHVRLQEHSDHVVEIQVRPTNPPRGALYAVTSRASFTLMDDGKRTVLEKAAVAAREAYADAFGGAS